MNMTMQTRPKLKHTLFIQTNDGVFVTGEGKSFHIKGKSILRWISALKPYLDGNKTIDEICMHFEPEKRAHAKDIIDLLLQRGVLRESVAETIDVLPEAVQAYFHSQLDYIYHFIDYPQRHFKAFRESTFLLYGAGESLIGLTLFLIHNGLKQLFLYTSDSVDRYLHILEPEIEKARQSGCELSVSIVPDTSIDALQSLKNYDVCIYCSDQGSLHDIFLLNQRCIDEECAFLATTSLPGQMMIGPLVRPGHQTCWLCAMMRLSANSDVDMQAALWKKMVLQRDTPDQAAIPSLPVARIIGQGMGFELFKYVTTCLPSETQNGIIVQSLETLSSVRSALIQHPLCPSCSHFDHMIGVQQLEEITRGRKDGIYSDEELYEQHSHLFDQHAGIFQQFADERLEQIPLKRSLISAGAPDNLVQDSLHAAGFSLDTPLAARVAAIKNGVGNYSRRILDTRGMLYSSQQELLRNGESVIAPEQLSLWSTLATLALDTHSAWLPGFSMTTNKLVYVPACAVYPYSFMNKQRVIDRTLAGTTVETTFAQAVEQGILSALAWDCQRALVQGRYTSFPLDGVETENEDLFYLMQSTKRLQRTVQIQGISWNAPLDAVIAYTTDSNGVPIATIGVALSGEQAIKMALQQLVQGLQLLSSPDPQPEQPGIGNGYLPHSLVHSIDSTPESPHQSQKTWLQSKWGMVQIQEELQRAGRDIIFVNTTSADMWGASVFISGTVLLTRETVTARG